MSEQLLQNMKDIAAFISFHRFVWFRCDKVTVHIFISTLAIIVTCNNQLAAAIERQALFILEIHYYGGFRFLIKKLQKLPRWSEIL